MWAHLMLVLRLNNWFFLRIEAGLRQKGGEGEGSDEPD